MSLVVHHLNCATMCPRGGRWLCGEGRLVCHCLLIETEAGLVLVDTGLGDWKREELRGWERCFHWLARPCVEEGQTALAQVLRLGFSPKDVRHIIPTHLDLDHVGGLSDFPHASVHVLEAEYRGAMYPSWRHRGRYSSRHWAHGCRWELYSEVGEGWFGFERVLGLRGLPEEILLIPLLGHSAGHVGVAVRAEGGWLLHAGDAYFYEGEVNSDPPRSPVGFSFLQWLVQVDGQKRRWNLYRLRELVHREGERVEVFCAHDPRGLERFLRRGG